MPDRAYSYLRFSSMPQGQGDSVRRQTLAALAWCKKQKLQLDEALTFRDLGKSAFRGKHRENPDRHDLAAFLELVKKGQVPRGSFLIVEALDRLTREDIQPALVLILGLTQAGIKLVQLTPHEMIYTDKSGPHEIMLMIVELMRGNSESQRKSDMISSVWRKRKEEARNGTAMNTGHVPAWIEARNGKLHLIRERAAVVKRLFKMSASGYGLTSIVRKFNAEKVPPFGEAVVREGRKRSQFSGQWNRCYMSLILRDRRAMGEYQPRRREGHKKIPEGDPIPDYFPPVVTEEEWLAARAGAAERKTRRGRLGKNVNIFAGLLKHARDGDTYFLLSRNERKRKDGTIVRAHKLLVNMRATEAHTQQYSFPADVFEQAILSQLAELDPATVLAKDEGPAEVEVLSGQLAELDARIAALEAELLQGDVSALARVLRKLEAERVELAKRHEVARQKAANPTAEAWREAKSLLKALRNAPDPDDIRLRLRSALRRIVESMWLLVVPRGRERVAVVQIYFASGARRDYLIWHVPTKGTATTRKPGQWRVRSWRHQVMAKLGLDQEGFRPDPKPGPDRLAGIDAAHAQEVFFQGVDRKTLDKLVFGKHAAMRSTALVSAKRADPFPALLGNLPDGEVNLLVEYDHHGKRVSKRFDDGYEARRFYAAKDAAGAKPKVRRVT